MSEWFSVLAVFWALWALDGLRLLPRRGFTLIGGIAEGFTHRRPRKSDENAAPSPRLPRTPRRRSSLRYSRLSLPGWLPTSWRIVTADVPLALSPAGICNLAVGATGRPVERSGATRAWRWDEIRHVGVARGWIFVNGEAFCADTGHLKATELLALARMDPSGREKKIEILIRLWFRPAHLRRRACSLNARTVLPASLNAMTVGGLVALTVYVVGDIASRLSSSWSARLAETLPWVLLGLFAMHVAAVVLAWRAGRRLRAVTNEKRGAALFSALLLPPQALRVRSILSDGFFPAQHPMAAVLAFADRRSAEEHAFNAIADLHWPVDEPDESSLGREIVMSFRNQLKDRLVEHVASGGIALESLLSAPVPDSPASCSYCPRCRDQFVDQRGVCPNGVVLRSLTRGAPVAGRET